MPANGVLTSLPHCGSINDCILLLYIVWRGFKVVIESCENNYMIDCERRQ